MILTPSQMQQLEQAVFARGVKAADLMEEAGMGIAKAIEQFFPVPGTCIVYCGKGHNAGDALVAAYHLAENGWNICVRLAFPQEELAELTQMHLQKLSISNGVRVQFLTKTEEGFVGEKNSFCQELHPDPIVLDGLLGIGSQGALRGSLASLCEEINQLRRERNAFTVAVDIPSGLDGALGMPAESCVQADLTVTIGFAKTGLIADEATNHVGRLAVVPLAELTAEASRGVRVQFLTKPEEGSAVEKSSFCQELHPDPICEVALPEKLKALLPPRDFKVHKGMFGRIGIVAGSRGYFGAARLASEASLKAGGGLVTLYVLEENYQFLATSCVPAVMVKPIAKWSDVLSEKEDALVIGPGLGREQDEEVLRLVKEASMPCVIDADALNIVASKGVDLLLKCNGLRLMTPHPGEMERLFPQAGRSRLAWAEDFIECYPVTLLLKGSRTIVAEKNLPASFNTTGNPGMATGGMGDVLSGVLGSFIGSGKSLREAAVLGAWLCGHAAELAIFHGDASEESLVATDIIHHLGLATRSLRSESF